MGLLAAQAQVVQQVTIGDNLQYGLSYNLPRTVVHVKVTATCTKVEAGPYAAYAERYLGVNDAPQADGTTWTLDKIEMQPEARPDDSRTYQIAFPEKGALPTFYLTADRCLLSINRKPEVSEPQAEVPVAGPKKGLALKASDVMSADILKAGSKARQADLASQEVFAIRESRSLLVKGEADNMPADGQSMQLMLQTLTDQELALRSLFEGIVTTSQHTFDLYFDAAEATQQQVLFRFSEQLGLVDIDDLAGEPYYVSLTVTEDNRLPEVADPKLFKKVEKGIAYCVPGKARITLSSATERLAEGNFSMAQFGHVMRLPQAQFTDKKKPTSALFVPQTGAIKIFAVE